MIRELTSATFKEAVASSHFAVVDCYGDFCFACELLEPVFNSIAERMPGIDFMRINLTTNFEIAEEMQIFDLPTILFYRDGELVVKDIGSIDEETFKSLLANMLYPEE